VTSISKLVAIVGSLLERKFRMDKFLSNCLSAAVFLGGPFGIACFLPAVFSQDNVVIVLDDSGSMSDGMSNGKSRMETAKSALVKVLKKFGPDTKLGVLLLNGAYSTERWAVPLEPLSPQQAIRKVESLSARGGTPLGERMKDGADALLQLREKQKYGIYRLLIVTDGEANDARLLNAYLPDILSRGLIVDAIGVDMRQDHSLANRVHSYRRADDDVALDKALQEVFAERSDPSQPGSDDEYALLEGIEDSMVEEVLVELSKPNNAPIQERAWPSLWGEPQPVGSRTSISVFAGLMCCFVPFAILSVVILVLFSKMQQKNKR
jgi:hypothetical protein